MSYQHRHVIFACDKNWNTTKCGAERICGADQNGDNLRINRTYLRISDYCSFKVRVRVRVSIRVRVRFGLGLRIVVCKLMEKVTKCGSVTYQN